MKQELKISLEQWEICILLSAAVLRGAEYSDSLLLRVLSDQPESLIPESPKSSSTSSEEDYPQEKRESDPFAFFSLPTVPVASSTSTSTDNVVVSAPPPSQPFSEEFLAMTSPEQSAVVSSVPAQPSSLMDPQVGVDQSESFLSEQQENVISETTNQSGQFAQFAQPIQPQPIQPIQPIQPQPIQPIQPIPQQSIQPQPIQPQPIQPQPIQQQPIQPIQPIQQQIQQPTESIMQQEQVQQQQPVEPKQPIQPTPPLNSPPLSASPHDSDSLSTCTIITLL